MNPTLAHQGSHAHLRPCRGCTAFRQTLARPKPRYQTARQSRVIAASATKEDVQEVQESSNAGRQMDPNAADLLGWDEIGERAGSDVLQGYQLLDHSSTFGQPRTAPTRVLPTEESTTTDRPVLLYRDTNAWCPFCERVSSLTEFVF